MTYFAQNFKLKIKIKWKQCEVKLESNEVAVNLPNNVA